MEKEEVYLIQLRIFGHSYIYIGHPQERGAYTTIPGSALTCSYSVTPRKGVPYSARHSYGPREMIFGHLEAGSALIWPGTYTDTKTSMRNAQFGQSFIRPLICNSRTPLVKGIQYLAFKNSYSL